MTAKKPINMLSTELVEAASAAKSAGDDATFLSVLAELKRRVEKGGTRFAKKALKLVEGMTPPVAAPTIVVETPPTAVSTATPVPAPAMSFIAPAPARARKPTIV